MKHRDRLLSLLCLTQALAISEAMGQAALTHGPVVGGVTASSANVFVRTNQETTVALRYGTDPSLATYLASRTLHTSAASDFTKIISLASLQAETTYYLNVVVNGAPHLTGPPYPSFKSFPASGASRDFKFVVLADFTTVQSLTKPTLTFASAAAELPDFVFIGGDFDHRNPTRLNEKRTMFKELYDPATPFMSDFVPLILERTAIVHQWDDHDAGANNLDRTYRRWRLSQQSFQEYVPSYPLPAVSPGIWQKFSYAQADCYVLDCRSQRDPEHDHDQTDKSMLDGNNLGPAGQLQWLKDGLLASTARWKIIFTSVITNPSTKFPDGWAGYEREWNELKDFIAANSITGVVFISGDLHLGAIDDGTASGFPEMCVAAANSQKVGTRCSTVAEGEWSEGYFEDPCPGYGLVTVRTDPDRLILQAVDESGNIRVAYTVSDDMATPTSVQPAPGL
jgi:alkaline phosphatase D